MSKKDSVEQVADKRREAQRDDDALSPQIRQLIFSFGGADSERTWDPDAFARRPVTPSRSWSGS